MSKLLYLDDGHGDFGVTAGKRTPKFPDGSVMYENSFNKVVVKYLGEELIRCGFRVRFTAPTDEDTSLATRVKRANDAKADLLLSVHANANSGVWGSWGGTETFTYGSGESLRIGKIVHKHLMKGTPLRDRGVKDGKHLYIIKNSNMGAILVESAFMDNLEEAKLLLTDEFRRECAKEIAMGICEAYGIAYVAETSTPNPAPTPLTGVLGEAIIKVNELNIRDSYDLASSTVVGKVYKNDKVKVYKIVNEFYLIGNGQWISNKSGAYATFTEIKEEMYRIRKSWSDASTQIGAYTNLDSAKDLASKNAGYKVFDEKGTVVYDPQPIKQDNVWFRVRKSWEDASSQIGAFHDLEGAKALADEHVGEGYFVFDNDGKMVYQSVKPIEQLYRVRVSWDNVGSQIGAFKELDSAKALADSRAIDGMKVYDSNGKEVYSPKAENVKVTETPKPTEETKVVEEVIEEVVEVVVDIHEGHHNITGKPIERNNKKIVAFVKAKNPNAQDIEEIVASFIGVGDAYNIRGDVALCQSLIETGWFKFDGGTAVTPDQHNYCGLGVVSKGVKGNSFTTVKEGVTAQIQHLYAYATTDVVPNGEDVIDPRFKFVSRGVAPHWEDLNMKWAMNDNYGQHIISIYDSLVNFEYIEEVIEVVEEPVIEESETQPTEDETIEKQYNLWTRIVDYVFEKLKTLFKKK